MLSCNNGSDPAPIAACIIPRDYATSKHIWVVDPLGCTSLGLLSASIMLFNSVRGCQMHLRRLLGGDADPPNASLYTVTLIRRQRVAEGTQACGCHFLLPAYGKCTWEGGD